MLEAWEVVCAGIKDRVARVGSAIEDLRMPELSLRPWGRCEVQVCKVRSVALHSR